MSKKIIPNGFLISFEGLEGCGKSTQIQMLKESLGRNGFDIVCTREPGGTELAEDLRSLLLSHRQAGLSMQTELLLLLAARADHIQHIINPALARGAIVIADRFIDASIAYQGYGREMGADLVQQLHAALGLWKEPHRTFLLDLPLELSFSRVEQRSATNKDRIECESALFFDRVRTGYLSSAQKNPQRFQTIDASMDAMSIHHTILATLQKDFYEYNLS